MIKKGLHLSRKVLKGFFVFILALLLLVNLFILLSGRTYLYKGIANTYLIGKSGPDIYDLDVFPYATLEKGKGEFKWLKTGQYNQYKLSKKEQKLHEETKSTAFLVFQGDELLFEKYWEEHQVGTVSNSFSAAKTVVALLVGIALDEKKIKSLDEPVGNYIPAFLSDDKKDITIRHLLQMASGLDWEESGKNPLSSNAESYYGTDLYGLVCRQKGINLPGREFKYQSGNSQLLSFVVESATGMKIWQYAQEKLWLKIGAQSDAFWSLDNEDGAAKAFCCLYASAQDFGKIGRLIGNYGNWNGEQVISANYIREMFTNRAPKTSDGISNLYYGLHIWTYNDGEDDIYYCRGILGQYVATIPSKNLVFVRLGHKRIPYMTFEEYERQKAEGMNVDIRKIDQPKDFIEFVKTAKKIVALAK
jgi:CubicO group peptidase (beta-lactamase class C family)